MRTNIQYVPHIEINSLSTKYSTTGLVARLTDWIHHCQQTRLTENWQFKQLLRPPSLSLSLYLSILSNHHEPLAYPKLGGGVPDPYQKLKSNYSPLLWFILFYNIPYAYVHNILHDTYRSPRLLSPASYPLLSSSSSPHMYLLSSPDSHWPAKTSHLR